MKRQLIILILAVLAVSVFFGVNAISPSTDVVTAENGQKTFRWLAAAGVVDFPNPGDTVCDLGVTCPDMAAAANGDTIEITGEGTLRVDKDGEAKKVDGGGTFTHNFFGGGSGSGTWEAIELLMFDAYGPDLTTPLPEAWNSGRALILIRLKAGGMEADAILEIGCRLPGSPGVPGTIEGIRLLISGGQNFNMETDPRSTLFIDITDQHNDD